MTGQNDQTDQDDPMTRDWFYTFGPDHINPITGRTLAKRFVKLYGTEEATRAEMNARFGSRWSMQYPSADDVPYPEGIEKTWLYRGAGVKQHGLTELVLENVEKFRAPLIHFSKFAACDNVMNCDTVMHKSEGVTCPVCIESMQKLRERHPSSTAPIVHHAIDEEEAAGCQSYRKGDWYTGDPSHVTCPECKAGLDVKD